MFNIIANGGYMLNILLYFWLFLFVVCNNIAFSYEIPINPVPNVDKEDISFLNKISKGISAIAVHANKGIVFVSVAKMIQANPFGLIDPFEFFFGPGFGRQFRDPNRQGVPKFKQEGLGSGFIIDLQKGYILTNNHVIESADEIHVKLSNGQSYEGKVIGRDKNTDIAVIKIKDSNFKNEGVVALRLGNSDKVQVGELCIAVGAPFGLEASVSLGVISAVGRGSLSITELGNFMQTDAAINPGNSGGPLLNSAGEVIGINSAIYSRTGAYNGIGFAIPINLAKEVAEQLITKGKIERGYLGVYLGQEIDADLAEDLKLPKGVKGALVSSVEPGGPADKAGIQAGDVITKVDDKSVSNFIELRNMIGLMKPNKKVSITFYRNGKPRTVIVKLGNYIASVKSSYGGNQNDSDFGAFGLQLANVTNLLKNQFGFKSSYGAVVIGVLRDSPADRAGIREGDVFISVNRQVVKNVRDFIRLTKNKMRLLAKIERAGQYIFVSIRQK